MPISTHWELQKGDILILSFQLLGWNTLKKKKRHFLSLITWFPGGTDHMDRINMRQKEEEWPHSDHGHDLKEAPAAKEKCMGYTKLSRSYLQIWKFLKNFLSLFKACGFSTLRLLRFLLCMQHTHTYTDTHTFRKVLKCYPDKLNWYLWKKKY